MKLSKSQSVKPAPAKTFGPAPAHEVDWVVTHRFIGERRFVRAQTAFSAVARAGWSFSEATAVILEQEGR